MSVFFAFRKWAGLCGGLETVVCMAMVSTVFLCLTGAGCKKRPAPEAGPSAQLPGVITNRMADAAYRAALSQNRREQMRQAGARGEVVEKMRLLVEQARARLPAGADDAAVKAELAKDPVWRELEAKNQTMVDGIGKTLAEGREIVRQRILAEKRDVKAVAEGKARAVGPPQGK